MNNLLVENEYHCIKGSFRLKILTFGVFLEKIRSSNLFRRTRIVSSSRVFLLESARKSSTPRTFSLRVTRRIFTRGHFTSPHEPLYEPRGRSLGLITCFLQICSFWLLVHTLSREAIEDSLILFPRWGLTLFLLVYFYSFGSNSGLCQVWTGPIWSY